MLMISLDDAVKVAKRLIADNTDDDEIIRQELVQKCRNDAWRQQEASMVAESMNKVISGINSTEICNQITSDNLRKWCEWTQCKLRIAMNYLPYQGKALPSAQPEPCEDAVSREAAIDVAENAFVRGLLASPDIRRLPSAQPERKKGEWIPSFNGRFTGGAYWFHCSKCERIVPDVRNGGWNFCPNCGADMRGEQDGNT